MLKDLIQVQARQQTDQAPTIRWSRRHRLPDGHCGKKCRKQQTCHLPKVKNNQTTLTRVVTNLLNRREPAG